MNYNVKRFTRPIKGTCTCNDAVVKSIANLANNNVDYRQYNKGFFIRQLGEVMENIEHGKDHTIIEPVVPTELTMAKLISELSWTTDTFQNIVIKFYNEDVARMGGFLLVLNKDDGSLEACHVIGNNQSLTVAADQLSDAFTQPLTDRFIIAVKKFIPSPGQATEYIDTVSCNYYENQSYYLYMFT